MRETPPQDTWGWSGALVAKLAAGLLLALVVCAVLALALVKAHWEGTPIHWFACGQSGISQPGMVEDDVAIDYAGWWLEYYYTYTPKNLKDRQGKIEKTLAPSLLMPMKAQMAKELKDVQALQFSSQLSVSQARVKERRGDTIVIVTLTGWRTAWQGSIKTRDEQAFEAEIGVVGMAANAKGLVIGFTKLPTALMVKPF